LDKKLHIICLDIPLPANYGGAIDLFYKIKSLSEAGCEITLHCFQYGGRVPSEQLNLYCKKVFYYKRKTGLRGLHFALPYIISSRNDHKLLENLCMDNAPILFDGLHTTYFFNHPTLEKRIKLLRAHNIEADYYHQLAMQCQNGFRKLYYFFEATRLKRYESTLLGINHFVSISNTEFEFFKKAYPNANHHLIHAFHANNEVLSLVGKGKYVLYHGNLSVEENVQAVKFLIKHVFSQLNIPFIIAGKDPSHELMKYQSSQLTIVANPSDHELSSLLSNAHIHVLPSFQNTGLKLKLLNALYQGRFCIANSSMLEGSGLESLVQQAETSQEWIQRIEYCMTIPFTIEHIEERRMGLANFDNKKNAEKLLQLIASTH
jgi:hypothetical protein